VKVSVITVVFNNALYISNAIESVLSQDYGNIEYIIIDGCSTDGTIEVIDKYRDCIQVFLSEHDDGIYDALNKGVNHATGDIVGFLHSDDMFMDKGTVSSIVRRFESSQIDVLYGDLDYVKNDGVECVVRRWRSGLYSCKKLTLGWMPPHPTVYARREVYQRFGEYDLTYQISADYDYMLRIFTSHDLRIDYLQEVLVKMRLGGVSNRSLYNIVRKSMEDYKALKKNQVGGAFALFFKNLSKLPQFFLRD